MSASLIPFFIVLLIAVASSEFFRRLHLPWVVALIIGGMIFGPEGFAWFSIDSTLLFIAEIGLIFLMFMAGLETKLNHARKELAGISLVAAVNSILPFALGFAIGLLLGLDQVPALLIGIIFMSSSVAVVVPAMEAKGILHNKLGRFIISSTLIQDVMSLVLLSVLMQAQGFGVGIPLIPLYGLVVLTFVLLRWIVPKVNKTFISHSQDKAVEDIFQKEVRWVFAILIGVVILFEILGLHPIVGAFLAGLILSDSISSDKLYAQLRTVSYGLFIPIFFVLVGAQTNLSILVQAKGAALLVVIILLASLSSKYLSGYLGGRLAKLSKSASHLVGVASVPQLSTTLAVAFLGLERGLLSQELVTALVVLSAVTTLIGPLLISKTDTKEVVFTKHK